MRWAGDALPRCAGNRNLLSSLCTSHLTILLLGDYPSRSVYISSNQGARGLFGGLSKRSQCGFQCRKAAAMGWAHPLCKRQPRARAKCTHGASCAAPPFRIAAFRPLCP